MEIERVTRAWDGGEIDRDVGDVVRGDRMLGGRAQDRVRLVGHQSVPRRRQPGRRRLRRVRAAGPAAGGGPRSRRSETSRRARTPIQTAGACAAGEPAPRPGRQRARDGRAPRGRDVALTARARVRRRPPRARCARSRRARKRVRRRRPRHAHAAAGAPLPALRAPREAPAIAARDPLLPARRRARAGGPPHGLVHALTSSPRPAFTRRGVRAGERW